MSPSATTGESRYEEITSKYLSNGGNLGNGHDTLTGYVRRGYKISPYLFDRVLKKAFPTVVRAEGNWLYLGDRRCIFDSTGGAAVSCLGHGNARVISAITAQLKTGITYLASSMWSYGGVEELCEELIRGTGGLMGRVYLTGSGSEAMEAALKLSRQFFYEQDKRTKRVNFIARQGSYHGNTLGALSISGHLARRAPYEPFLMRNVDWVSACNPYRQRLDGESDEAFVARKAAELEAKFQELGPETVIAFIAEPVVGAALGCVPSVPGYLKAMRDVCHRHGALFVLDEVMSGMGRCGTLHAWQEEGVVPDIQTIGKGLAGGYQPVAAVLVSKAVVDRFERGSGQFIHGQTFQAMPAQARAALEVQKIVREGNLVQNVAKQGAYLGMQLKLLLEPHPNVGNVRGRGLFWGIEFVKDKRTKEPFPVDLLVAQKVHELALSAPFNISLYPGTGTKDGVSGDHVILSPPYIVTQEEIDYMVNQLVAVVDKVFSEL